jgi:serine/threonine-protein kinase
MLERHAIPGFTLGRRLGGGPTCDVWTATDARGRTVAVKQLKTNADDDAVFLLHREAVAGQAIRHANVVEYRSSYLDHEPPFLVLEFLFGESARQRLDRRGVPSPGVALGWLRQTAEALAAVHDAGFVHGDIKPANLLITGPGTVKLIDLGFARRPGDVQPWADRGHILGTANYLAPELTVLPPVDSPAADLFSFGVLAFELLTGRLPYGGRSTSDVVKLRRQCQPADLRIAGTWPTALVVMIADLTDPIPANRPRAAEVVNELAKVQIAMLGRKAA